MAQIDRLARRARPHLDDETVFATLAGTVPVRSLGRDSHRSCILLVTERRIVRFLPRGGDQAVVSLPLSGVTTVEHHGDAITFRGTGDTALTVEGVRDREGLEAVLRLMDPAHEPSSCGRGHVRVRASVA